MVMLTQDDFDPTMGPLDSRPEDKRVRILFHCLPELREMGEEEKALDLAEALEALEVDVADVATEMLPDGAELDAYSSPDERAEYHAEFDSDYTYQYEYKEDIATIELAAHSGTFWAEPMIRWRVTAGAGAVAGKYGRLNDSPRSDLPLLDVGTAVHWEDDPEEPIIASGRFSELPVPQTVADGLLDDLDRLQSVTHNSESLETDPHEFPDKLQSPVDSFLLRKPIGWDPQRNIMWYAKPDEEYIQPSAYQIERNELVCRNMRIWGKSEAEPLTWQDVIDKFDLEPAFDSPE